MAESNTILAAVDGFSMPATLSGWAIRWEDGSPVADLRIEALRDGLVIASTAPSGPRPDVTHTDDVNAAFTLDCPADVTVDDLMGGSVSLQAVDAAGEIAPVPIWGPIRDLMSRESMLRSLREAEAPLALDMLDALSSNRLLSPDIRGALKLAGKRATKGKGSASPGPKITFIGAGSTVFAKALIGDILLHPALSASRIYLYDIDQDRLRTSEIVASRICQALSSSAVIETTSDLGLALDGADYAITMIQVGGYRPATIADFEIPKRFGLRQTIGDTVGIGGIMRGLRTIPVLLDIVAEMERRCPNVVHLNYANPMAINCWALGRASSIRTIGLCHSVPLTAAEMARDIGVDPASVNYLVAGINHMAFYLKFEADGEDLYPKLRQIVQEDRAPAHNRVRYDVLKRLGYFVTESSEHFAEYVPWYIKRGQHDLIEQFNIPLDEYPRRCESQIEDWKALSRTLLEPGASFQVQPSQEYGSTIINAMQTGEPAVVYANVPNAGLISNLPQDCCAEVPCLVDGNGIQPVRIGALPPQLAALMQTNINVQALTVEAALTGRRDHIYHAAMLDPHTAAELNLDQIWSMVDAMLESHRAWLPEGYA